MKKIIALLLVLVSAGLVYSAVSFYDELGPEDREDFAADWLETGEAYMEVGDDVNAKACFRYAHKTYPMGDDAASAREYLSDEYGVSLEYDPVEMFDYYVDRAESMSVFEKKVNNYLMALEIREDEDVYYELAVLYYENGDEEEAADYINEAVKAGYDGDIDAELEVLIIVEIEEPTMRE